MNKEIIIQFIISRFLAQYDTLGGSTQISDEGIAPVTSVIGSLNEHHGNNNIFQTANNVQSSYLPPSSNK